MKKKTIKLKIDQNTFPIVVGDKILSTIGEYLPRKVSKIIVLSDKRLIRQRQVLLKELKSLNLPLIEIPVSAGEGLKDIQSVYPIYGKMLDARADRDSLLVALGGGTIGDVGGFIASTYLRGIPWIGVPTTLLAQVDSSVGGKTGINHSSGKNLIGTFYQPSLVVCDLSFLKTLGPREMTSGVGEIVKYAFTFDRKYFKWLEKNIDKILMRNRDALTEAITKSLEWKSTIVSQDVQDRLGVREVLNFGHTFGHALEAATGYKKFQHGEAVIWGMRFALHLSVIRGKLSEKKRLKMDELLQRLRVPSIPKDLGRDEILKHVKRDKKAEGDKVRFVLLDDLGHSVSDKEVTKENLNEAFFQLTGRKM